MFQKIIEIIDKIKKNIDECKKDPCYCIYNILKTLENGILIFVRNFNFGEDYLNKTLPLVLWIWKLLLLATLIFVALADYFNWPWFDKNALQGVYSMCKGINIFVILIGTLIGASLVYNIIKDQRIEPPFVLVLMGYITGGISILYELLPLVALSSIILAYYISKCRGATPNTWGIINSISNIFLIIGVIGLLLSFIQSKLSKWCKNDKVKFPRILILTSLSYFIILMITLSTEKIVSNNVMFWLSKIDNENFGIDCVEDNTEGGGFANILQTMLSLVLTFILLILILLGLLPPNCCNMYNKLSKIHDEEIKGGLKWLSRLALDILR